MTTVTLPIPPCSVGAEEYSFDLDEFEKKNWNGAATVN